MSHSRLFSLSCTLFLLFFSPMFFLVCLSPTPPSCLSHLLFFFLPCILPCFISFSLSLRWNVVGVQGSLMSYFSGPIYFSSIILGSLYHADHLSRAMYQRVADIEELPQPFTLNRPLLSGTAHHHHHRHYHHLLYHPYTPLCCSMFQKRPKSVPLLCYAR